MKTYTTAAVGRRCSAACEKTVGEAFVRECYLTMYKLEPQGPGRHLHLTNAQAELIKLYAVEWHGSSLAPGIGQWAQQRGHVIPGLRKSLLPAITKQPKPATTSKHSDTVAAEMATGLAARMAKVEADIRELKERKGVSSPKTKRITDRNVSYSLIRRRIGRAVVAWVRDRSDCIDYETGWSEFYRGFWELVGDPPGEWYENQLDGDSKLFFFEQQGLMDLLGESLAKILSALGKRYPVNNTLQRDLGL